MEHDIPVDEQQRLDQLSLARKDYLVKFKRLQAISNSRIEYENRWQTREQHREDVETRSLETTWLQTSVMRSHGIYEYIVDAYVIEQIELLETDRQAYFDRLESCMEQLKIRAGLQNLVVLKAKEVMDSFKTKHVAYPHR